MTKKKKKEKEIIQKGIEMRQKIIEDEKQREIDAYQNIKKLKKAIKKIVNANTVNKSLDKLMTSFKIGSNILSPPSDSDSSSESDNNDVTVEVVNDIIDHIESKE